MGLPACADLYGPIMITLSCASGTGPRDYCLLLSAQANLKLGEATQLVGGYAAAVLAASCVIAAVYLGLLVRCVLRLSKESSAAATRTGDPIKLKHLLRPLGAYLWPVALTLWYALQHISSDCRNDVVDSIVAECAGIFTLRPRSHSSRVISDLCSLQHCRKLASALQIRKYGGPACVF